jgi:predicted PurR-regulated permease PerM
MDRRLSLSRLAHFLLVSVLGVFILIQAKPLLIPLVFALFFSSMLHPLCSWLERWIPSRAVSILLAFFIALLPIALIVTYFSVELSDVFRDLGAIGERLKRGVTDLLKIISTYLPINPGEQEEWLRKNTNALIDGGLNLLTSSLSSSTFFLASLVLVILYTFFLLLYRTAFKNFVLIQFAPDHRDEAKDILGAIQKLTRQYLYGMLLVMLILAVLNSTGLWLIGIDYAAFWGSLAAFLAIIPYIGTTLGGTLPFLYAIATASSWWQPLAVVLLYMGIQNIEGNFITSKVVGNSVDLNPMMAILSLFIGGAIWGISGLILALPIVAALKVFMEHITVLQPVAELLGSGLYRKKNVFLEQYDADQFRLINYFRRKEKKKPSP